MGIIAGWRRAAGAGWRSRSPATERFWPFVTDLERAESHRDRQLFYRQLFCGLQDRPLARAVSV
ncbi:MAG: hypothetical protein EA400_03660 [Chromatiaceae bacterium]|nr:MAG: hypothetical protein EA400_03660 [Chromatiaceae bacterium]